MPDEIVTRAEFYEWVEGQREKLRVESERVLQKPKEEPVSIVTAPPPPPVDSSIRDMEPGDPDDVQGYPEIDEDNYEEPERRYKPPVEHFAGQPGHPDELSERIHLSPLGTDFPVLLGKKPDLDEPAEDLAASYGG